MQIDDIFREIREFGVFQISLYCMLGVIGIPSAFQNMAITFLGSDVDHWCYVEELQSFPHDQQKYISIPYNKEDSQEEGSHVYDRCHVFQLNYSSYRWEELASWDRETDIPNNTGKVKCDKWVYDQTHIISNAVTEWDLVCDDYELLSIIQTVYMAGFLTGCVVFGQISDKIGRKKSMMIGLFFEMVFALAATFTPIYELYVILRFLVGACVAGSFTSMFVLCMETIGAKWRMEMGIFVQVWFALGIIIISGIAYFVRDFVKLQLVMCLFLPIFTVYIWVIPESPRWLVAQGRDKETELVFLKIAQVNRKTLPKDLKLADNRIFTSNNSATIVDLFRGKNIRVITVAMWFGWFVTSLAYYGLSLGVALLPGSLYVNNLISGAVEIPAYAMSCLLLNKVGRKWPTVATFVLCGVFCIVCGPLLDFDSFEALVTVFLMLGKFFGSAAFAILYVYAAELFPTVVRNVGVGSSSMCARVGGIVQPQIQLLSEIWIGFPFIIYGVTSLVAGLSSLVFPETLNQRLPETLEDVENLGGRSTKKYEENDKETSF